MMNKYERFIREECAKAAWSIRQFGRQINIMYYQRILASRDQIAVSKECKQRSQNQKNTIKEDTKKDNVKTGDSTVILPFMTLMCLACVALIFLKKKRA